MQPRLNQLARAAALACLASLPLATLAATAEEAAALKTTLTPLGAEKAGNKDGSIPAWDGVYTKITGAYKPGDARADPFAAEKPVLAITGKNVDQYAAKLSAGTIAMLKKYPDFRLDVYPTHRTGGAPSWVYENTFKNATRAKTVDGGYGVEGAYGGIPFPIPKTGYEAVWNHRLAWVGDTAIYATRTWIVTPDGKRSLANEAEQTLMRPYYFKEGSLEKMEGAYQYGRLITRAPASKAGEGILAHDGLNSTSPRALWQYLVGQRRVRRAPSVAYDTPDSVTSGIGFFDEAFMMFGPIDHHELKLIGKKEMYIPYNNNRAAAAKIDDLVGPRFLNPDLVRWELHRVWEVEATVAPGKRHVVAKRRYYLDEDTWQAILTDGYDAQGQIWRSNYTLTLLAPDIPAVVGNVMWGTYNVQTGAYLLNAAANELPTQYKVIPRLPVSYFGPEELANQGSR
ncbi:DUF1329 domain-containing protein [Pseudoduganella namucuonensis]|uniref:DUF1329 domain-containing protein n=1 Tax=Pseudoduganella namucuonensis TaxID=1035707 RepID=A0A1I7L707_9BURK|nr:DUF1329 domain-containing protein [Pseudoduganella namucuonensis]SFV05582.1 Protein of unknown function [Pseudoduganella namucuonensis]